MAINYRQPQQLDSLSSTYQMLVQAEMAKAQAMGQFFDPLTRSIQHNQELSVRRDEAKADALWKDRYAGQQERQMGQRDRELNMKQSELDAEAKDNAAFGDTLQMLRGGAPSGYSASNDGSSGGAGGPMGTAGGVPSAIDRHGPEIMQKLAGMRPERAMRMMSILDSMDQHQSMQEQRAAQIAEQQRKIKQGEENIASTRKLLASMKTLRPDERTAYEMRLSDPNEATKIGQELTERVGKDSKRAGDAARLKATIDVMRKSVKKDFPGDADKLAQVESFASLVNNSPLEPEELAKEASKFQSDLYGVGKPKEKPDKGPFKFLEDDPHFAKGGLIERAPDTTKANVQIQAMTMAAQQRMLSTDALSFMSGSPDYKQITNFYDKLDAVEKDTIKTFEDLIWKRGGWKHVDEAERDAINRSLAAPKEGLPYNETIPPSSPPQGGAPQRNDALFDLTPEQRSEALKLHKAGDREALKEFLLKTRTPTNMKGSVMEQPKPTPKPRDQRGTMQ